MSNDAAKVTPRVISTAMHRLTQSGQAATPSKIAGVLAKQFPGVAKADIRAAVAELVNQSASSERWAVDGLEAKGARKTSRSAATAAPQASEAKGLGALSPLAKLFGKIVGIPVAVGAGFPALAAFGGSLLAAGWTVINVGGVLFGVPGAAPLPWLIVSGGLFLASGVLATVAKLGGWMAGIKD